MRMNEVRDMKEQKEIKIGGMSCSHCVMHVRRALTELEGVDDVDVAIGSAKVKYDPESVDEKTMNKAIVEAGYEVL
jgi:copper ion binding protein|tara:strand:+ start:304 stop:531 length:228 start_codon:yes stop_codon:yes gene_type:complete